MEKKTPFYDVHVEEGGKIVPFAGYLLPVQYEAGVIKEHMAVREECGLFDVSHMGEILFTGPTALATLNHILTNDFTNMKIGKVRYSVMCYDDGTCVDDVLVYKFGEEEYFVVVNAANKDKDYKWMSEHLLEGTTAEDISDSIVQIAIQGAKSKEILQKLLADEDIPAGYYTAIREVVVDGIKCIISRTGYTGSWGYELYCSAEEGPALWKALRKAGEGFGLTPCGLGARDTLRLEASMPLYGHEMDNTISPIEAGLGFAVKLGKEEFIGKDALVAAGDPKRVRVGLEVTGRGIIREHQDVFIGERKIGVSTSGSHCPYLGKGYAMALVNVEDNAIGTEVEVEVRGRRVAAKIVEMPFYSI